MSDQDKLFVPIAQLSPEAEAARKKRNLWLGLALAGFVILVGIITMVRLATTIMEPGSGFYYNLSGQSDLREEAGTMDDLPEGMDPAEAAPPPAIQAEIDRLEAAREKAVTEPVTETPE